MGGEKKRVIDNNLKKRSSCDVFFVFASATMRRKRSARMWEGRKEGREERRKEGRRGSTIEESWFTGVQKEGTKVSTNIIKKQKKKKKEKENNPEGERETDKGK